MKIVRFGVIGGLSGLVFAGVNALFAGFIGVEPKLASVAGYVASMPLNFVGNRRFAFRSRNGLLGDFLRFILLHAFNIVLTAAVTGIVVDFLKLNYIIGIISVIIIMPCVNFLIMNRWVFGKAVDQPSSSTDPSNNRN